jgi:excisionase family DNA binding protein
MTTMPARLSRLLTVADAAEHLKVDPRTVRRLIKKKTLHFHQVGRQLRVSEEDLAAYLGACRR